MLTAASSRTFAGVYMHGWRRSRDPAWGALISEASCVCAMTERLRADKRT